MGKRIVVISDFDETGSGYRNLCIPLLTGLANSGHEIKVAGLGYQGREHNHPFSIIPALSIQDAQVIASNLSLVWQPDIYLVAMDIPLQEFFYNSFRQIEKRTPQEIETGKTENRKYIAITPLENGPLTLSWAAVLLNMDAVFFISELGKQEAIKAGLTKAEHLIVGVDAVLWHPATPEEKSTLRKGLGIGDDEFVILTVADNQERKNLWAGLESIRLLKEKTDRKLRHILVTRVDSPVGWKLNDLAVEMGLTKELMTFNRGLPVDDLWGLYAVSDVYLSASKAEGLGMPVLEAMACGIPCVATDTGALREVLGEERGHLVPAIFETIDVWGNEKRSFIDANKASKELLSILETECAHADVALEYIKSRDWRIPINQINSKIQELSL